MLWQCNELEQICLVVSLHMWHLFLPLSLGEDLSPGGGIPSAGCSWWIHQSRHHHDAKSDKGGIERPRPSLKQLHSLCTQRALCVPPLTRRSSGGRTLPLCSLIALHRLPPFVVIVSLLCVLYGRASPRLPVKIGFPSWAAQMCVSLLCTDAWGCCVGGKRGEWDLPTVADSLCHFYLRLNVATWWFLN